MSTERAPSSAVTSFVVASRYLPVYIALLLLVIVASIWAPATLSGVALRAIAPYGTVLGIAADPAADRRRHPPGPGDRHRADHPG